MENKRIEKTRVKNKHPEKYTECTPRGLMGTS